MSRDYNTESCSDCSMYDEEDGTCYERRSEFYLEDVSKDHVCDKWTPYLLGT